MAKYLAISITYDPDKFDRDQMAGQFDGYDGGGYCFVNGLRDVFFNDEDVSKEHVSAVRKQARNLRRRKGVEGVSVVVLDDEE